MNSPKANFTKLQLNNINSNVINTREHNKYKSDINLKKKLIYNNKQQSTDYNTSKDTTNNSDNKDSFPENNELEKCIKLKTLDLNKKSFTESINLNNIFKIINKIVKTLNNIILKHKSISTSEEYVNNYVKNVFDVLIKQNQSLPSINLTDYITRVFIMSNASQTTLIQSIVLLDKFLLISGTCLNDLNVYLIFLTSFYVSLKLNEDGFDNTKDTKFCKIALINIKLLTTMEKCFIELLNYKTIVTLQEINNYFSYLK